MSAATPQAIIEPAKVYRRLLAYARPHLGMFMIGVAGMALFAAMDSAMAWLVKVFLGDMSNLEGLFRIASFVGLGLCLVGIGWLYQHFVRRPGGAPVQEA